MATVFVKYTVIVLGRNNVCWITTATPPTSATASTAASASFRNRFRVMAVVVAPLLVVLRNPVVRERKLCTRSSIVGWLAGVGSPSESERVIEERLEDLAEEEVWDVRLVVGTVADRFAQGRLEFRQPRQCLADVVAVLLQNSRDRVELVQRRRQLLL